MSVLIDDLINLVNRRNIFQIIIFIILGLTSFQNFCQIQLFLLSLDIPKHVCKDTLIQSQTYSEDQCFILSSNKSIIKPCKNWIFEPLPTGETLISEFQLVCGKSYFKNMILVLWYSTNIVVISSCYLSDKYGRKPLTLINLFLETLTIVIYCVAPDIYSYSVFRVLSGITSSAAYITYVWLIESINVEFKPFAATFMWIFGVSSYIISPIILQATQNWRKAQLICLIPSLSYLLIFFIPESPRWLHAVGKIEECKTALKTIVKVNQLQNEINIDEMELESVDEKERQQDSSFIAAFNSDTFLKRTLILLFLHFSTYLFYSAVLVNIRMLSKDVVISNSVSGLMEVFGIILSYISLLYWKRKKSLMIFTLSGVSLYLLSIFFSRQIYWQGMIRLSLGSVGRIALSATIQIVLIFIAENFPTSYRSFSMYLTQIGGFFAFIGALYINKLDQLYFFLPMIIYFIQVVISLVITHFTIPETNNLTMPETLYEQSLMILGQEDKYEEYIRSKYNPYNISVEEIPKFDGDNSEKDILIRKNS